MQARNYSGSGNWLDENNSHEAVPTNSPVFVADGNASYWELDGGTMHLLVANHANLEFNNVDWTIMVVCRPTSFATHITAYANRSSGTGQSIEIRTTPLIRSRASDGTVTAQDDDFTPTLNADMSIGGVYDDSAATMEAYLNGLPSGSPGSGAVGDQTTGQAIRIGSNPFNEDWVGRIYAVAVWRAALTDAEMLTAHNILNDRTPEAASSGASAADLGLKHPRSSGAARRRIVDLDDPRRKYRLPY